MTRTETQLRLIRRHLLAGNTITPAEALRLCGCFRLSAIIYILRHTEDVDIVKDYPEMPEKHYARYWIEKGWLLRHADEMEGLMER
jgi:hypothetical protein